MDHCFVHYLNILLHYIILFILSYFLITIKREKSLANELINNNRVLFISVIAYLVITLALILRIAYLHEIIFYLALSIFFLICLYLFKKPATEGIKENNKRIIGVIGLILSTPILLFVTYACIALLLRANP